ncbi:MAG: Hsp20/alpha crystallin family protein, partial [Flammeovirgaceae bacterium]
MVNSKTNWSWPLHTIFDEVFDDLSKVMGGEFSETRPKVNIWEVEGSYTLELAVPGFNKDEIKIDINGNKLMIEGKKEEKEGESVKNFKR